MARVQAPGTGGGHEGAFLMPWQQADTASRYQQSAGESLLIGNSTKFTVPCKPRITRMSTSLM